MIIQTPVYRLRAPDDTELVRDGAKQLRDLASDVEAALQTSGFVKKSGDTMTGDLLVTGHAVVAAKFQAGANDLMLHSPAGQVVVMGAAGTPASGTVSHADASYANQSMTLGQKASSSREFKENIVPLNDAAAFDQISPVAFDYKPDTEWANEHDKAVRHAGFIAEDVEAAGLGVSKTSDGTVIGLRESELIAVLWSKVQELEGRLAAVEGN